MPTKKFQKKIEDFVCKNCGTKVTGSGYTNHCPNCLWSKHVDVNPGDRKEPCQGMMEPVEVEQKNGEFLIIHKCQKCGLVKRNRTWPQDNFELITEISQQVS